MMTVEPEDLVALSWIVTRLLREAAERSGDPSEYLSAMKAELDDMSMIALQKGDEAFIFMNGMSTSALETIKHAAEDLGVSLPD